MAGPMHGPHGRGPRPKLKNPGKLFSRLMSFVLKRYGFQYLLVLICILISFCIDASENTAVSSPNGMLYLFNPSILCFLSA